MTTVNVFAPAKINLTLHVTGQRDDGYHFIDSLVTFGPMGDQIVLQDGNTLWLTVEGPEAAGVPADMDNIALRAAMQVAGARGAAMTLHKNLPVASGIGGGSADAAAAFRGMMVLGEIGDSPADGLWASPDVLLETQARGLLVLGADVPMCLFSRPCRVRGIGEKIALVDLPDLPAVLVNPRVPVATPEVFCALAKRDNAPMPDVLPNFGDATALIDFLATCRNDLQQPAIEAVPEIGRVLDILDRTEGCKLARMTGSGATCFGLFADAQAARDAARRLFQEHPDWWVAGGLLGDQSARALPRRS